MRRGIVVVDLGIVQGFHTEDALGETGSEEIRSLMDGRQEKAAADTPKENTQSGQPKREQPYSGP